MLVAGGQWLSTPQKEAGYSAQLNDGRRLQAPQELSSVWAASDRIVINRKQAMRDAMQRGGSGYLVLDIKDIVRCTNTQKGMASLS